MKTPGNRRILVIDDNESIIQDFRKILCPTPAGGEALDRLEADLFGAPVVRESSVAFELDGALQGRDGYRLVMESAGQGCPYAVAFVDMRMPPGWDGLETIEHLWRADPGLQAVICTAYSDYSWDQVVQRLGHSDKLLLLKKPFDKTEVWQMASALAEKWELTRQARAELSEAQRLAVELQRTNTDLKREVDDRIKAEAQLRHHALYDQLTGLPNRAFLMECLQRCIERGGRSPDYQFAVLFIDLDDFKTINDSLGHDRGDALLVQVAKRLSACLRSLDNAVRLEADAAARLGGDEFVIVLDGIVSATDAAVVAERLIEQIAKPCSLGGKEVLLGASIGIAVSHGDYTQAEEILHDADTAMYRAKAAGRSRYSMFDQAMHTAAQKRLTLENDLRRAIVQREFALVYQPIVELATQRVVALEALLRWNHPERSVQLPLEFMEVAEDTGTIDPIGRWVLEEACKTLRAWQRSIPEAGKLRMHVNIAPRQLRDAGFTEAVRDILSRTQVRGNQLCLEITESAVLTDIEVAKRKLEKLRELGVTLAFDDFGTGYSSLSCLQKLPLGEVKIDRAITSDLADNQAYAGVIRAVVSLAHCLRLKVTVEGIETSEQLARARELDCDFAQGFLFQPPVAAAAAEHIIREGLPAVVAV